MRTARLETVRAFDFTYFSLRGQTGTFENITFPQLRSAGGNNTCKSFGYGKFYGECLTMWPIS